MKVKKVHFSPAAVIPSWNEAWDVKQTVSTWRSNNGNHLEIMVTHRMKQYPTSQKITGAVIRNQREIQVWVFTAILSAVNWQWRHCECGLKEVGDRIVAVVSRRPGKRNVTSEQIYKYLYLEVSPPPRPNGR